MTTFSKQLMGYLIISFITASACADGESLYQERRLPDGSNEIHYMQSDGTRVKQIQHVDGTMTVVAIDTDGNETMTITNPDGSVETKMSPRKIPA